MFGPNGLTGQRVLKSVVEGTNIGHGLVKEGQRSVRGHHICLVVATRRNAKVCCANWYCCIELCH
jgi:hypothetical protein